MYDGVVHLTLSNFIAIGVIIAVWAFNIFGIRPFKGFTYVTAGLLTVALVGLVILPFVTGHWHSSNVHATFTGPWGGTKQAFVYLFILGLVGLGGGGVRHVRARVQDQAGRQDRAAHLRRRSWSACSPCCRSRSAA